MKKAFFTLIILSAALLSLPAQDAFQSLLSDAEKGGGGTIAKFMARYGMDVIDFGTPLLNMHAPWELASKSDCWNTKCAYKVFFES